MPLDTQKLKDNKERILDAIRQRGPMLPVQIAKVIGVDSMFASAFLSDLHSDKRVVLSNLRVGSSPLYFIKGQEKQLERFVDNLNSREREAFEKIKEEKVLEDGELEPVVRVALREINDFASPVRVRVDGQIKLFWRYAFMEEDEVRRLIQEKINSGNLEVGEEDKSENVESREEISNELNVKNEIDNKESEVIEGDSRVGNLSVEGRKSEESPGGFKKEESEKKDIEKPIRERKPENIFDKKQENINLNNEIDNSNKFSREISESLSLKNIRIVEVIEEKKKDFFAKVEIEGVFGKQGFYLTAKDKKKIDKDDLALALQKANEEYLPGIFLSSGDLTAKAEEYLKKWSGLLKFVKLN